MNILETVQALISPDADTVQLTIIIDLAKSALLDRFRMYKPDAIELPPEADYLVVEVAIARFNRISSEGLRSESVDGDSATYEEDLTAKYDRQLRELADQGSSFGKPGRIRAL